MTCHVCANPTCLDECMPKVAKVADQDPVLTSINALQAKMSTATTEVRDALLARLHLLLEIDNDNA